jgi:hypothetical protein
VGEPVDRGQHVVDVSLAGVSDHVICGGGLPSVADLARRGDIAGAHGKPPH